MIYNTNAENQQILENLKTGDAITSLIKAGISHRDASEISFAEVFYCIAIIDDNRFSVQWNLINNAVYKEVVELFTGENIEDELESKDIILRFSGESLTDEKFARATFPQLEKYIFTPY